MPHGPVPARCHCPALPRVAPGSALWLGAPGGASCPCRSVPAGAAVPFLLKQTSRRYCVPARRWVARSGAALSARGTSDIGFVPAVLCRNDELPLLPLLFPSPPLPPPFTAELFPSAEFPSFCHPLSPIEAMCAPVLEVPDGS